MKLLITFSGATLLTIAASLFFINLTTPAALVFPDDPVFSIPIRTLFWIAGSILFTISIVCLFGSRPDRQLSCLAWLSTCSLLYTVLLYLDGCESDVDYLLGFTEAFGLSGGFVSVVVILVTVCVACVSYISLFQLWHAQKLDANSIKMSCSKCGVHIKFSFLNLGQMTQCPQCKASITLRKNEDLKMACYFCQGHIAFPSYAIGEKLTCPHCKMDITLK